MDLILFILVEFSRMALLWILLLVVTEFLNRTSQYDDDVRCDVFVLNV